MKRPFAVLVMLAAACTGCSQGLMQRHQAAVIRFEPDGKTLSILMVYQGLHVGGGGGAGTDAAEQARTLTLAKQELEEFVASGRKFGVFLFGKIGTLEFEKPEEIGLGQGGKVTFGPLVGEDPATAKQRASFAGMGRIETEPFFLDPKEGLCLRQTITVDDAARLARSLNALISADILRKPAESPAAPAGPDDAVRFSPEARAAILAAAQAGHDWLRITPGRIALNFPISEADAASILKQAEASRRIEDRAAIPALRAAIESFDVKSGPDGLTLSMGDGKKRTISIRPGAEPTDEPRRDAELIAFARTLKLPFDATPDVATLIREFAAK